MPKEQKTKFENDDKVHVDFAGDIALFIRKFAFDTGKSNSEAAHALMRLIISAEETTTVLIQKEAEFKTVTGKPPRIFKNKSIKQIKIAL
jgi:hypothetical protein